jgi:1,4-alpha-glucan branching enzyme
MNRSEPFQQDAIRKTQTRAIGRKPAQAEWPAEAVELPRARKQKPVGLIQEHSSDSKTCSISFEYSNSEAREVMVAGSFNDWQPTVTPMTKKPGGLWCAQLLLKPGHYEYRFIVDGQWKDDPRAAAFVANPFGGSNGVIDVKPARP